MKTTKLTAVILCFLAIVLSFGQAQRLKSHQKSCTAPNGFPGKCVDIHQCPHLLNIIASGRVTQDQLKYLQKTQCGFVGSTPIVCCAGEDTPIQESSSPGSQHSNTRLLPLRECGIGEDSKIFGGSETEMDEFPWTAQLVYQRANGDSFIGCGGSLISNRYVLTAAHCTAKNLNQKNGNQVTVTVTLGEYNKAIAIDCEDIPSGGTICADPPRTFHVAEEISHPNYDAAKSVHDIALLRLDSKVTPFSDYIKPICVPIEQELVTKSYVGKFLTVTGWGSTENGTNSDVKLKVNVPVVDFESCRSIYSSVPQALGDAMEQICAGGQKGKDSCSGDSGGPLMSVERLSLDGTQRFHVVGLTSFGPKKCGQAGWPAVYTRVAGYSRWILDQLRP